MKRRKTRVGIALAAALAIAGTLFASLGDSAASAQDSSGNGEGAALFHIPDGVASVFALSAFLGKMTPAAVERVVDGDTLVVSLAGDAGPATMEKIRLIGVDTPETVDPRRPVERFGIEASNFSREKLLGKTVRLAFEGKLRDNYGRLLAYVFLEDGSCFNLLIVSAGYGFAYTKYPFLFMEDFREAERSARVAKRGLWGNP